jgi:DNA-binding beta-propeller fold protein YncE
MRRARQAGLGAICALLLALAAAAPARADFDDPTFVFTPIPKPFQPPEPPPFGYLETPCGLEVDSNGNFYVADYHHNAVQVFNSATKFQSQVTEVDPLDGPCGLALDSADRVYVNDYHRDVILYPPAPAFGAPTSIDAPASCVPPLAICPTGVAVDPASDDVYVNHRTHVVAYDSSGAPLPLPLQLGVGSLGDGYGLAVSGFPGTAGRVYVPDAADDTVKVFDPAIDPEDPIAVIDGAGLPGGGFNSLRDSAVAVDDVSGKIYVADLLQPPYWEEPEGAIYVFSAAGAYLGRLKHNIVDAQPPGIAVDNSAGATQGRVYVTSGNTEIASIFAYPPGAETSKVVLAAKRFPEAPKGAPPAPSGGAGGAGSHTAASATPPFRGRGSPASASEVAQKGNLRLALGGDLAPRKLPREGSSPVAVTIDWKLSTTDETAVPPLKQVRIEINRHGRLDYSGLPTCPVDRIQPASSERALTACRSALVGQGSFEADVALAGQERYAAKGRLLVFNGKSRGKPVLLGQIYSPRPFATSFVIVFEVQKLGGGTYGTALSATLPKALAGWGNLTGVRMKLSRRYRSGGESHSYLSAGCPAPKGFPGASFPLTRTSFDFAGGLGLSETLTRSCRVR